MTPETNLAVAVPGRTGRPRRARARAAILAATVELLAEHGFPGTTMNAIAARAGVSKNTIYRRWPSKEELIADALLELTAELDVKHEGTDLYALLLGVVRDVTDAFADSRLTRILPGLLGETQRNPAFAAAYVDRVVRPRRQAIVRLLNEALDRGELRRGSDPDQIADLLIAPAFMRALHPLGLPQLPDRYVESLLETVWRGIAPCRSH
jgi:AcrR family transcriptional regulator